MLDYWFDYGTFGFTSKQNIWAIQNLEFFERGEWPPLIGDERGEYLTDECNNGKWIEVVRQVGTYTEIPIRKRMVNAEAYFVKPCIITAEIKTRLKSTKKDGETLIWEVQHGLTDIELLSPSARSALFYISGIKRRGDSYPKWLADRKYRIKHDKNAVIAHA